MSEVIFGGARGWKKLRCPSFLYRILIPWARARPRSLVKRKKSDRKTRGICSDKIIATGDLNAANKKFPYVFSSLALPIESVKHGNL